MYWNIRVAVYPESGSSLEYLQTNPQRKTCSTCALLQIKLEMGRPMYWVESRNCKLKGYFVPVLHSLPLGEKSFGTHEIGGWLSPRVGLDSAGKEKTLPLQGIETRTSGLYPSLRRLNSFRLTTYINPFLYCVYLTTPTFTLATA
jgi:hypothetical protein